MGLDMYLSQKMKGSKKEKEIGYWRKANQIHSWFVENVQNGVDNCGDYPVSHDQLNSLLEICEKIIKSTDLKDGVIKNGERLEGGVWVPILEDGKEMENSSLAEILLPRSEGFLFGSQDYDEYYYQDIQDTIEILKKALLCKDGTIYYGSSW